MNFITEMRTKYCESAEGEPKALPSGIRPQAPRGNWAWKGDGGFSPRERLWTPPDGPGQGRAGHLPEGRTARGRRDLGSLGGSWREDQEAAWGSWWLPLAASPHCDPRVGGWASLGCRRPAAGAHGGAPEALHTRWGRRRGSGKQRGLSRAP